jgi:photosystem II stability/assembly factor-like uncharacterized protein
VIAIEITCRYKSRPPRRRQQPAPPRRSWENAEVRVRVAIVSVAIVVALGGCGGSSGPKVGPPPCRWHVEHARPGTTDDLTGLSFPDDTHGWAVGGIDNPTIRATTDGGRTWHAQHAAGTDGLDDVSFVDDRHGWAVGVDNLVLTTSDGGIHWTAEHPHLARTGNLYGVWFVDARYGWIIGSGGVIETTADGGKTWTAQQSGTHQDLESVQFLNRRDGWIQTDGEILRTTNGGVTWTSVYAASAQRSEIVAGQMFLSPTLGWASGSQTDSSANHGLVSRTTDGGRTWTTHDIKAFDDVRFGAIAFTDAKHGWVAGYEGELFYTDNGGISFAEHAPSAIEGDRLIAMVFHGPTHGWAVGEYGTIIACTP